MKSLRQKVTGGLLLLVVSLVHSQTINAPWVIGVGAHAVNHKSIEKDASTSVLNGGYANINNYKLVPPPTRLSIARNLNRFFVADLQLSLGSIANKRVEMKEKFFMSASPGAQFKFNSLWKDENSWFDPYFRLGAGILFHDYRSVVGYGKGKDEQSQIHFIASPALGSNFWITNKIGIGLQLEYAITPGNGSAIEDYFQVSMSMLFRFGKNDTDGDGVPDHLDRCPTVPGPVESQGCPDLDKDGVPDIDDMCPTVFGPPENAGCPWPDADGDGIPDHLDKCPTVPGTKEYNGCPPPARKRVQNDHVPEKVVYDTSTDDKLTDLFSGILFDTDSAVIKARSISSLDAIAQMLKGSRNENFLLTGHTDTMGDEVYNIQLAKKRIESVVRALAERGVNVERLRYKIVGSREAIYTPNAPHKLRLTDRKVVVKRIASIAEWNTYDRIKYELRFLDSSSNSKKGKR